eukprot:CAMPEP_0197401940 /NCGR_PEP_ID=MMETSP1165-20131217/19310_1 /TAXON_ID=284809 /ORGANISM="Chrysocystis fragilis, Strain CCMP3189" /LENGTH=184 /DNA_ID=CAMNT_0042928069 /DNA_START=152 /DNA_END=706 /DNA_ORIENTATION=-
MFGASEGGSLESLYQSTRSLLTGEPRERSATEQLEDGCCEGCPKMSYKQRLIGFALCFGLGVLIEFGSFFRLVELVKGNPKPFAVCYTVGNIISICASFFLSGPWNQAKKMFAKTRVVATIVYVSTIVLTLFCALYEGDIPGRAAIIILLIIVQMCALLWYMLSFIPYARELVSDTCRRTCCDC